MSELVVKQEAVARSFEKKTCSQSITSEDRSKVWTWFIESLQEYDAAKKNIANASFYYNKGYEDRTYPEMSRPTTYHASITLGDESQGEVDFD